MIKFDRDEFLRPQIYSTKEEYQTRYKASNEIIKDIKELQERIDKAINNLEKSIESINNKLGDKEIRVENGIVVNPINDYRIVRLKAIRTKCKEILEILKGGKE